MDHRPAQRLAVGRPLAPGAHLLHYPIADGSLINFLAVVDGPDQWTAPAWMQDASPGAHLAAFTGWHPAVTGMLTAMPQSPRWALFTLPPLRRWSRAVRSRGAEAP